jgi:hypothetical protein
MYMESVKIVITNYHLDNIGIGNVLKCLITGLSINDDTVIECYPDYIYGKYDTILDNKFIYGERCHNKNIIEILTCRLCVLKSEEHLQPALDNEEQYIGNIVGNSYRNGYIVNDMFSHISTIDWNYNPDLIHPCVKNRIIGAIRKITFHPTVIDTVSHFSNMLGCGVGSNIEHTLAISVRTWKASHESDIKRPYDFSEYYKQITNVLSKHTIKTIVFSIDNHSFIEPFIELFNRLQIKIVYLTHLENINDIQYAISKVLILSKCKYFIGNRISTFSELVFWFGECLPVVYTVY